MARVNAYLYLLRKERPENPKYITDYDLLPTKHPKSTRKNNAILIETQTEVKLVDKSLQEQVDFAVEDTVNEDDVVETKSSSADTDESMAVDKEDMMDDEEDMMDDENKEDMKYPKEDMKYPKEDKKEMSTDKEPMEMKGHDKEPMKMAEHDKEKEMSSVIAANVIEEDDNAEETKESGSTSLTKSERAELKRFRKEEKEKVLALYKEFLSEEVYSAFSKGLDSYNKTDLETQLKLKVADYFLEKAKREAKETKVETAGFKTLQVIGQMRESKSNDLAKLIDKYKN